MAVTLHQLLALLPRAGHALGRLEIQRSFSRWSNALHVVQAPGHPVYDAHDAALELARTNVLPAGGGALLPSLVDQVAGLPIAPTATDTGLDTAAFGSVRYLWRNTTGVAPATLSFRVWVHAGLTLGWVRLGDNALVPPNVEQRLDTVGYRRIYFEVTAAAGGTLNSTIYVGGEA